MNKIKESSEHMEVWQEEHIRKSIEYIESLGYALTASNKTYSIFVPIATEGNAEDTAFLDSYFVQEIRFHRNNGGGRMKGKKLYAIDWYRNHEYYPQSIHEALVDLLDAGAIDRIGAGTFQRNSVLRVFSS